MHELVPQSTADVLRQITQQPQRPQPATVQKAAPPPSPEELARIVSEAVARALTEVYAQLKLPAPQIVVNMPPPAPTPITINPELTLPPMTEKSTVIYGKDGRIQGSVKEIRPT
jgi:hypothetical protein